MRALTIPLVLAVLSVGAASPSYGQKVSKGTLTGTLKTGVATTVSGGPTPFFTAGTGEVTTLVKLCGAKVLGGTNPEVFFSGNTLGVFGSLDNGAVAQEDGSNACIDYSPGLVLPRGEVLSCGSFGGSEATCTAIVIVSRK
jgi:hypothetical protein